MERRLISISRRRWLLYSLVGLLLDRITINQGAQAKLQAEVLALRRQAHVLERQIKRVQWSPDDRMIMVRPRRRRST
jgi:hypothetical protein